MKFIAELILHTIYHVYIKVEHISVIPFLLSGVDLLELRENFSASVDEFMILPSALAYIGNFYETVEVPLIVVRYNF